MRSNFRIPISNDINDEHFPVKAFFNAIPNNYFLRVLENLINGVGSSFNDAHCEFPNDLDPDEDTFIGVRFAVFEDEVVLDYKTLYLYLLKACEVYINDCPESKEAVQSLLCKYTSMYGI